MGYLPLRKKSTRWPSNETASGAWHKAAQGWGGAGRARTPALGRSWAACSAASGLSRRCAVFSPWTAGQRRCFHILFSPRLSCTPISVSGRAETSARQLLRQLPPASSQPANPTTWDGRSHAEAVLSCKIQVHSQPPAGQPVLGGLGPRQAVVSPPTAAVSLNSGATHTPRRARLGSDGSPSAAGAHRELGGRAAGGRRAHHAPEPAPEEKSRRARSRSRPQETATPPSSPKSNRRERVGRPRSDSGEAIKGTAGRAARSFTSGFWERRVVLGEWALWATTWRAGLKRQRFATALWDYLEVWI